jgi:hypothetical protein
VSESIEVEKETVAQAIGLAIIKATAVAHAQSNVVPKGLSAHHCASPSVAPTMAPETAAAKGSLIGPSAKTTKKPPRGNARNVGIQRIRTCVAFKKTPNLVYNVNYGIFHD